MFTDLTDDRGMFTNARRQMWKTAANGYHRELNQVNLNYQKDVLEQKLFRGYQGSLFLRKKVCGDKQFTLLFAVNKTLDSPR
jgi:dTDP-4-dehydrorhamnose 3,5-epimerase-like enzyme